MYFIASSFWGMVASKTNGAGRNRQPISDVRSLRRFCADLLRLRLELSHDARKHGRMPRSRRESIHVTVPCRPDDPRRRRPDPEGVTVHYVPELHPDDVTVVDGIPCTSVARTLVARAAGMEGDELRDWLGA